MPSASPENGADDASPGWSGVHRGPLAAGEWVRLTDAKGRRHNICLEAGKQFFTNKGAIAHDDLIGRDEGFSVPSTAGGEYLVFRPLLSEFVVSMPRGAAVVYPKDAAQIVAMADIFPGARVVEAGVGSGALTCSLLRAVGPGGVVSSYERREEFADVARRNVTQFFGGDHPAWRLTVADLVDGAPRRGRAQRRPGGPGHARALGVRRRRRRTRSPPAASSAPTSPPPRSSPGSSRRCAPTASSPSRSPGRRSSGSGTSRASRSDRAQDERPHRLPGHRPPDVARHRRPREEAPSSTRRVRRRLRRATALRTAAAGRPGAADRLTRRRRAVTGGTTPPQHAPKGTGHDGIAHVDPSARG